MDLNSLFPQKASCSRLLISFGAANPISLRTSLRLITISGDQHDQPHQPVPSSQLRQQTSFDGPAAIEHGQGASAQSCQMAHTYRIGTATPTSKMSPSQGVCCALKSCTKQAERASPMRALKPRITFWMLQKIAAGVNGKAEQS